MNVNRQVWERLQQHCPKLRAKLRRFHRKALVGPLGFNLKGIGRLKRAGQITGRLRTDRVEILFHDSRTRQRRDAEHARQPLDSLVEIDIRPARLDINGRLRLIKFKRAERFDTPAAVFDKRILKGMAVQPLERKLPAF